MGEKIVVVGGGAMALLALGGAVTKSPTVTKVGAGAASVAGLGLLVLSAIRVVRIHSQTDMASVQNMNSGNFLDTIGGGSLLAASALALLMLPAA